MNLLNLNDDWIWSVFVYLRPHLIDHYFILSRVCRRFREILVKKASALDSPKPLDITPDLVPLSIIRLENNITVVTANVHGLVPLANRLDLARIIYKRHSCILVKGSTCIVFGLKRSKISKVLSKSRKMVVDLDGYSPISETMKQVLAENVSGQFILIFDPKFFPLLSRITILTSAIKNYKPKGPREKMTVSQVIAQCIKYGAFDRKLFSYMRNDAIELTEIADPELRNYCFPDAVLDRGEYKKMFQKYVYVMITNRFRQTLLADV